MRFLRPFYFIFMFVFCLAADAAAGEDTLVIGHMGSAEDRATMAVLTEAYGRLGIPIKGRSLPAARCLKESRAGRIDGEANRIKEIEGDLPELIRIPVPVNVVEGIAFVRNETIQITDWDDLKPYRVGIRHGVRIAELRTEGLPFVQSVSTYTKAFDLLALKRLDVVVASRCEGDTHLRRLRKTGLHALEEPLEVVPLYHYLNKKHADLVPDITEVLREMEQSGRIREILAEYGVPYHCRPQHTQVVFH